MAGKIIKDGILLTQNSTRQIIRKDILIEDGIILAIEDFLSGEEIWDARGQYISPGFIQSHIHLGLPFFTKQEGMHSSQELLKVYSSLTESQSYLAAKENIQKLLSGGTTTLLAMEHPLYTRQIVKCLVESGMKALIGNSLLDHGEDFPELQKTMEEILFLAAEYGRKWSELSGGTLRYLFCPWSIPLCSGQLWGSISKTASEYDYLIHTHACESKAEVRAVRHGRSSESVQYLDQFDLADNHLILAHMVWPSNLELDVIQRNGVNIILCPTSNEFFEVGTAPVAEMIKRGINIGLGSDGTFCNPTLSMFEEMKMVDIHQIPEPIDSQVIFDMATINGAKALRLENEIGSIEVGKKADLVILDIPSDNLVSPITSLVKNGQIEWVDMVMMDGKVVYKKKI